jgi:Tfp pilus assembly protein PilF
LGDRYNDIGAYLTQQGTPEETISWLDKAKQAWWEALREFEEAVRAAPDDQAARKALSRLRPR